MLGSGKQEQFINATSTQHSRNSLQTFPKIWPFIYNQCYNLCPILPQNNLFTLVYSPKTCNYFWKLVILFLHGHAVKIQPSNCQVQVNHKIPTSFPTATCSNVIIIFGLLPRKRYKNRCIREIFLLKPKEKR